MKILQIAPWEETVPPQKYGGTELVVSSITEELVRRHHDVYLIAAGNSKTKAHLIPIFPRTLREEYPTSRYSEQEIDAYRSYWKFAKMSTILEIIQDIKPDVIHNHLSWRLVTFSHLIHFPFVSTLHGPLNSLNEHLTYTTHKDIPYIAISNNQRKALPDLNWIRTIYHGIDLKYFNLGDGEGNYFLFLGRTTPQKGLAELCKMIKETSHTLKIAAKVDAVDQDYFEKEIKPYIDGRQIEFLGEVDYENKRTLLKKAKGLLLWLNWEEPFGLVVAEAMACGTPVIANRRGSMPELIQDGETGFLVDNLDEMKAKLNEVNTLSRQAIRTYAEKHFSIERMVDEYISVYEQLISHHHA